MEEEKNPSLASYWEDWYEEDGPGKEEYEWYNITCEELQREIQKEISSPNSKILQVGSGNSIILESILDDSPSLIDCTLINVDISHNAIEQMLSKQKEMIRRKICSSNSFVAKSQYVQMDATQLSFDNESFDIVFDKGTIDALLSHGGEEIGENEKIQSVLEQIYRVLCVGGKFLLISGNDSSVLFPYLYSFDWRIESIPIQRNSISKKSPKVDFGRLNINLYSLKK